MRRLIFSILCATALAGCAARADYTVAASVASPGLAYVGPGIYAVVDYDYPVFYADHYYWRFDRGRWYQSPRHDGAWVYRATPPRALVTIREPNAYVRYRPDRRQIVTREHIDRHRPIVYRR